MTEQNDQTSDAAAAEPKPIDQAVEDYIARSRARMQAAIDAQPYRGTADFADLLAVGEAVLRSIIEDRPDAPPVPTKAELRSIIEDRPDAPPVPTKAELKQQKAADKASDA